MCDAAKVRILSAIYRVEEGYNRMDQSSYTPKVVPGRYTRCTVCTARRDLMRGYMCFLGDYIHAATNVSGAS